MASFEEEYRKIEPVLNVLSTIALLSKKIVIRGNENFIRKGPNLIVGNHIGTFKDVAAFIKIAPRCLFPIGNRVIFDKHEFNLLIRKHLSRHLHKFGLFLDLVIAPVKSVFVNFISATANRIGAIPVDMTGKKSQAIEKCQEYLKQGRAVIILQGRGRVMKKEPNPYVSSFRRGPSIISYKLKEEGIDVPVTPVATFGTHRPFLVPGKVKINIGEPMFIKDYLSGSFHETVNRFREAMEKKVQSLFFEILNA